MFVGAQCVHVVPHNNTSYDSREEDRGKERVSNQGGSCGGGCDYSGLLAGARCWGMMYQVRPLSLIQQKDMTTFELQFFVFKTHSIF